MVSLSRRGDGIRWKAIMRDAKRSWRWVVGSPCGTTRAESHAGFWPRQAGWCTNCHNQPASTGMSRMPANRHRDAPAPREQLVLILSHDPVAAVLLGGLVETLGYEVHFAHPPESGDDSL